MFNPGFVDGLLKFTLAFITLSLGCGVSKLEIRRLFAQPKELILGLATQMVLLPLIAIIICFIAPIDPILKLGILIISFCPGGTTANLLSYLFGANVGLSVSLTATNGILCLITIPLFTELGILYFQNQELSIVIPYLDIVRDLILVILIPGTVGVFLNGLFPSGVKAVQTKLKYVLPALLVLIFGIKFFAQPSQGGLNISVQDISQVILPLISLNLLSILGAFFTSHYILKNSKNSLTIAIETGLQNTALALLITASSGNIALQKPAVIYAAFSFFSTAIFIFLLKKNTLNRAEGI